ncbi:MAG: histidinol-phosphate transaminase [Burkholderiales bacterium]|nr:histidinol-phosphate transaminase [Burkholderiales bacterium]
MSIDICEITPSHIRSIFPYAPGKPIPELERELGIRDIVKLASNENPLGTSPKALMAAEKALLDVARYPDGNGFELKAAISERYGIERDAIVLGNGSNDLLELAARAFLEPGCSAVFSQHAFAVYSLAVQAAGAKGIEAPAKDWGHDLDAMFAKLENETRMVFIANPNNPTGTLLEADTLLSFMKRLPPSILVVLDEAYDEYLPSGLDSNSMKWLADFPNLIVTRTFSKAYGLAGLRVGFALAHPLVADMMNRVRQPFNVNSIAQAAAIAALSDTAFLAKSHELNLSGMSQLKEGFAKMGLEYIPSYGNFLSFHVGHAHAIYQKLLRLGVIVRPIAGYAMPEHLRVSIGLESENDKFLQALKRAIGESA